MRHTLYLIIIIGAVALPTKAQHVFQGTSLSEALITLDQSSSRFDVNFVYDELEDFTVSKTIKKGRSLPDAVREVCGFYPVKVRVKGRDIFVECVKKDRTKLIGRLVDSERQPVAYANITLFHPSDSTYLGGGVSNEAGDFVIPCSAEKAKVRISCVGFKTIERTMAIGAVGTIRMQMENYYLNSISVNGHLPIFHNEADRLQYIVANDQYAKGQNALELLNRVPMVTMMNGHASILGKGDAGFMLNGQVMMQSDEAIRQKLWAMHAEDIERIEVISNPSGRYQMDAAGGYINIVTNRDQTLGWRGDITGQAAISDDWSGLLNGTVSYASKKFDMTAGAYIEQKTGTTDNNTTYHIHNGNDLESSMVSDTRQEQTDKNFGTNASLRFMPIKNIELGAIASYRHLRSYMDISDVTTFVGTKYSEGQQVPRSPSNTFSLTAYFDWTLDSLGRQLSLTFNNFKENDDKIFTISTSIPSGSYYRSRCSSEGDYLIRSLKLDFSLPFRFATFETGVAYTHVHNEAYVSDKRILMGLPHSWSTDYDYQERTKAFYLTATKTFFQRLTAKAGLRFEWTALRGIDRMDMLVTNLTYNPYTGSMLDMRSKNNRDYSKVLPSLLLNYRFKERQQLSLNWNMGISRPNFYYLNPFEVYSSSTSIKTGNPALLPSTSNNVELSYSNGRGLNAALYYHHGQDMIDWITAFHPEVYLQASLSDLPQNSSNQYAVPQEDRNYSYYQVAFERETRPLNCYDNDKAGLYLRYQHQISPQFSLAAEGDVYFYHADADVDASIFLSSHIEGLSGNFMRYVDMPDLSGWGKRLALSADLFLNSRHTLLLNARYDHIFSEYNGLTKYDSYANLYLALRYSLLKDRLKLSLVAQDPFGQHILNDTKNYLNHRDHERLNPHIRCISLTATWSLGGKSVRRIQRDTKDTETQRAEKQ